MRSSCKYCFKKLVIIIIAGFFLMHTGFAQDENNTRQFRVKNNMMTITISKKLPESSLENFLKSYSLKNIGLNALLKSGLTDSILRAGWKVESSKFYYTITKALNSGIDLNKSADRMVFSALPASDDWQVLGGNRVIYGVNNFKNKESFRQEADITYFLLRGFRNAKSVMLAGSFTDWQHAAFPLTKTNEGWIAPVRLKPGKYFYKFIIDGNWITDPDNLMSENDGQGNVNSVYYAPNKTLFLKDYQSAKSVVVTGSFNNWAKEGIPLLKKAGGWEVALYLQEGTHRFHFLVDGRPVRNDGKTEPDQKVSFGKSFEFNLKGFKNARKVFIAGDFNGWNPEEILMNPTVDGWKISYVLGPGNYQYKFIVDGNWMTDPANPDFVTDAHGNINSFVVVAPNHTFRLNGYPNAKKVHLAGEFNNWTYKGLAMTRSGNAWTCDVYLGKGKHLYKFIVDGNWIRDPLNPLWEDGSENSVLWIE